MLKWSDDKLLAMEIGDVCKHMRSSDLTIQQYLGALKRAADDGDEIAKHNGDMIVRVMFNIPEVNDVFEWGVEGG